jgi:hypothetical protein
LSIVYDNLSTFAPSKSKIKISSMKNLIRIAFIALALVTGVISYSFTSVGYHYPSKITVCHTPPGNPGNCHEIEVSINALQAHLDHGDALVCHNPEEETAYMEIAEATQTTLYKSY